jgi:coproporphyrinogen III oxidase
MNLDKNKLVSSQWFNYLRYKICSNFAKIERDYSKKNGSLPGIFSRKKWSRSGGGGSMSIMKGQVFEKVGVNVSTVWGDVTEGFYEKSERFVKGSSFWASGISLVSHMQSPKVPAVHMNLRYVIIRNKDSGNTTRWFGGGVDLTPIIFNAVDINKFHRSLSKVCDFHHAGFYPKYKGWCDKYFFLPHRGESRGVGGVFFDYLNSSCWSRDFSFVQDIGRVFLNTYVPIVGKNMLDSWSLEDRRLQLRRRSRYSEFNLLFDRGTQFGLKTKGNIEAIFMSLPPEVHWI